MVCSARDAPLDLLDSLVIFMPGHRCSVCLPVSSISQALSSTACLGLQYWDSAFMLVCEVLRALNQIGALGFSKIIKINQDFGNKIMIQH